MFIDQIGSLIVQLSVLSNQVRPTQKNASLVLIRARGCIHGIKKEVCLDLKSLPLPPEVNIRAWMGMENTCRAL